MCRRRRPSLPSGTVPPRKFSDVRQEIRSYPTRTMTAGLLRAALVRCVPERYRCYPLPQEYTLKGTRKTLDDCNVKALTNAYLVGKKSKRQKAIVRWEERLPVLKEKWKQMSQLYKYNFLTPRDSYLHFNQAHTSQTNRNGQQIHGRPNLPFVWGSPRVIHTPSEMSRDGTDLRIHRTTLRRTKPNQCNTGRRSGCSATRSTDRTPPRVI